jgi:hypothetical protein
MVMALDPRLTLQQFIAALERHHEAVATRRSQDDPAVENAYELLKNAFLDYEEALESAHGEWLPFEEAQDSE